MAVYLIEILAVALIIGFLGWMFLRRKIEFERSVEMVFFRVLIPKKESDQDEKKETTRDFREYIGLTEQLLSSLKAIYSGSLRAKIFGQQYISLEYVTHLGEISFLVVTPKAMRNLVEKQITSFFSDAVIDEIEEMDIFKDRQSAGAVMIGLKKPFYMGIKTHQKLESDPINAITNALSKLQSDESCVVQILLRPVADGWQKKGEKFMKAYAKKKNSWLKEILGIFTLLFQDPDSGKDGKKEIDESTISETVKAKAQKTGYEATIRVVVTGSSDQEVDAQIKNVLSALSQLTGPEYNSFTAIKGASKNNVLHDYVMRYFTPV